MTTKTAMPSILRCNEIMTTNVMTVAADSDTFEAANALTERHVSGAPVLRGSSIVGVVSKTDLTDTRKEMEVRVDKVMTPVVYAVRASDPVYLAVQLMVDESIHRVIVVDDFGHVAGIVTGSDVLRAIRDGRSIVPMAGKMKLDYVDLRKLGNK